MLEPLPDLPPGVIGMRAVGTFTIDDYTANIVPIAGKVRDEGAQLRLVLHLGREFSGFGPGAWGELTSDLRSLPFYRGAVVTDDAFVRTGLLVLRFTLKGHVRSFGNADLASAIAWVAA